jgi:hypothetical protein
MPTPADTTIDEIPVRIPHDRRAACIVTVKPGPGLDIELGAVPGPDDGAPFGSHEPGACRAAIDRKVAKSARLKS